jgi:hypothetical protein
LIEVIGILIEVKSYYYYKNLMLKKGKHIEGTATELQSLLNKDKEANNFFESLAPLTQAGVMRLGR